MNNKLILIVGESGTGKDTIIQEICKRYGYKQILSYTTRPKRYPSENTHIFVSEEEFWELMQSEKFIGYTKFDKYEYGATLQQGLSCDFYVVDMAGVRFLKHKCNELEAITVYIHIDEETRKERMRQRGDTEQMINDRIKNDRIMFQGLEYDYKVVNNDLEQAINDVYTISKEFINDNRR